MSPHLLTPKIIFRIVRITLWSNPVGLGSNGVIDKDYAKSRNQSGFALSGTSFVVVQMFITSRSRL
jgi:hypothetical protein